MGNRSSIFSAFWCQNLKRSAKEFDWVNFSGREDFSLSQGALELKSHAESIAGHRDTSLFALTQQQIGSD